MVAWWRSKVLQNAPLEAFCNTFDLYKVIIGLENQILVFFLSGRLRQVLLYDNCEGLNYRNHLCI